MDREAVGIWPIRPVEIRRNRTFGSSYPPVSGQVFCQVTDGKLATVFTADPQHQVTQVYVVWIVEALRILRRPCYGNVRSCFFGIDVANQSSQALDVGEGLRDRSKLDRRLGVRSAPTPKSSVETAELLYDQLAKIECRHIWGAIRGPADTGPKGASFDPLSYQDQAKYVH